MRHGDPKPPNKVAISIAAVCVAAALGTWVWTLDTSATPSVGQAATQAPSDTPTAESTPTETPSASHSVASSHRPVPRLHHRPVPATPTPSRTSASPSHVPTVRPTRPPVPVRTPTPRPVTHTPTPTPTRPWTPPPRPTTRPPSPTPTPTPDPTVYVGPEARLTAECLMLFNQHRTAAGLPKLARYSGMDAFAQEWADHMAATKTMVHRTDISPYRGEIIAYGYPTAQQVVDAWMASPGHRAIIMDPSMTKVGIGVNVNGYYWAANFS